MLKYTERPNGNIRVYCEGLSKMGWADFDMQGILIDTCIENWMSHFPHELDAEIAKTIKTFEPAPFDCDVYLRFNDIPKGGKSKNWATGKSEKGLSVYPLTYNLIKGCYNISGNVLQGAVIQYIIQQANIYFVTGKEVGTGSDNEPLLADVEILSQAQFNGDGYVI